MPTDPVSPNPPEAAPAPTPRPAAAGTTESLAGRLVPDRLIHETPVLDQLTDQLDRTRRLLAGDAEEAAESALARFAEREGVSAHIAVELAAMEPLAAPERFPEAHRIACRALEVLDREGPRDPRVPRLGPATVVVEYVVETVAAYIVKSYVQDVANAMRRLYARREAQCPPDRPERRVLARARMEMERIAPGYGGGSFGPMAFVFGGILIPLLASAGKSLGGISPSKPLLIGSLAVLFVFSLALSSMLMQGAAQAHRRSRQIMNQPLAALWETIGHAGNPPEDDAVTIATVAVIFTAVLWFILPALGGVLFVVL